MKVNTTARSLIISYQQYIYKMSPHKKPERRTYLQDRLEILIKKQESGTASFNELTELDEIVNRDPAIREMIIMDNFFPDEADNENQKEEQEIPVPLSSFKKFINWLKDLKRQIFNNYSPGPKRVPLKNQLMLI